MTGTPEYPTSLGTSDADTISLLGQNLAEDLMGKVGFCELVLWMVTQRCPTPPEVRVFESVLVALADHGFTPIATAARLTYLGADDAGFDALALAAVKHAREDKKFLPGLGHPVHQVRDPRTPVAGDIYMQVDRNARYVVPPSSNSAAEQQSE